MQANCAMTTDRALVLKAIRFEDRHLIVTGLTEHHGKITAMARNAIQSKRFGSALDLFALGNWTWSSKPEAELKNLGAADLTHGFSGLRQIDKLTPASVVLEIAFRGIPAQEPHLDLFRLVVNTLSGLESAPVTTHEALLTRFVLRFLHASGNKPILTFCMICEKTLAALAPETTVYGYPEPAALACADCAAKLPEGRPLFRQDVEILAKTQGESLRTHPQLELQSAPALLEFLVAALAFHVPGFDRAEIKSLRALSALQSNAQLLRASAQHAPSLEADSANLLSIQN